MFANRNTTSALLHTHYFMHHPSCFSLSSGNLKLTARLLQNSLSLFLTCEYPGEVLYLVQYTTVRIKLTFRLAARHRHRLQAGVAENLFVLRVLPGHSSAGVPGE